ncbi:MAG: divergent PAP2 family protein [Lentisphaerota bacterium]
MTTDFAWYGNISIWAGVAAWILAQCIKLLIFMMRNHKFDSAFLFRLGGMPSSHSAAVVATATSIGLRSGFSTPLFALALGLSLIVMIDAQSVRRAAGQQARLLNQIVDELFKSHHFSSIKLVEFLGHTRLEVFLGMILGILCALLCHGLLPLDMP